MLAFSPRNDLYNRYQMWCRTTHLVSARDTVMSPVRTLATTRLAAACVCTSRDRQRIACITEPGIVTIWTTRSSTPLTLQASSCFRFDAVTFAPDGQVIATASSPPASLGQAESRITVWDVLKGTRLQSVRFSINDKVSHIAFDDNGSKIACLLQSSAVLVLPTGLDAGAIEMNDGRSFQGLLHTTDFCGPANQFQTFTTLPPVLLSHRCGWEPVILPSRGLGDNLKVTIIFSADGTCAAATFRSAKTSSNNRATLIWDLSNLPNVQTMAHLPSGSSIGGADFLALSPDGSLIACVGASYPGQVEIWSISWSTPPSSATRLRTLSGRGRYSFTCVAFSADASQIAAGTDSGSILVWDIKLSAIRAFVDAANGDPITSVSFVFGDHLLVSAGAISSSSLLLVEHGTIDGELAPAEPRTGIIKPSPDGRHVALLTKDNLMVPKQLVRVWNMRRGTMASSQDFEAEQVTYLSFNNCGSHVFAICSSEFCHLWPSAQRNSLRSLNIYREGTLSRCATVSNNASMLAAGYFDGSIILWNPTSGQHYKPWLVELSDVDVLNFDYSGQLLAAGAAASVCVYKVTNGDGDPPLRLHVPSAERVL